MVSIKYIELLTTADNVKMQSFSITWQKTILSRLNNLFSLNINIIAILIVSIGLILRLIEASQTYLNPDEAVYFWYSLPNQLMELYRQSLWIHHPPLLVFLLHFIGKISYSEMILRIVPIIAGASFPFIIYLWLGRMWSTIAGLLALTILTFAPHIISLSAQIRAYTLLLFFMSTYLYFMDRAIEEKSLKLLLFSILLLYLGTLTEYSFIFFTASVAIYFLLRIRGKNLSQEFLASWIISQIGVIALYGFYYITHIRRLMEHSSAQSNMEGWLRGMFPWPGDGLLAFGIKNTVGQFTYLFASKNLGIIIGFVFLFGLILLWKGRSFDEKKKNRAMLILFAIPFLFACLGAIARIHPYGHSRHTVFLTIFIAAGVAVALESFFKNRTWIIFPSIFLLIPLWYQIASQDPNNIEKQRHQRKMLLRAIQYIQKTIPSNSLILIEEESKYMLRYYLRPQNGSHYEKEASKRKFYSNYHLYSLKYSYDNEEIFFEDLMKTVKKKTIALKDSVWVIDGGWNLIPFKSTTIKTLKESSDFKDFGKALIVIKLSKSYIINRFQRFAS